MVRNFSREPSRVVVRDGVLSGTPVVSGTRVPAETVLAEYHGTGGSRLEVFANYPSLPLDAIEVCLEWERAGKPICTTRS